MELECLVSCEKLSPVKLFPLMNITRKIAWVLLKNNVSVHCWSFLLFSVVFGEQVIAIMLTGMYLTNSII